MFSKDLVSATLAQVSLRGLAILEPDLIMPQVVERAAEGLEIVNETHRTTAVLSTLSAVTLPLVNESMWFGGQNHLLTLLARNAAPEEIATMLLHKSWQHSYRFVASRKQSSDKRLVQTESFQ